MECSTNKLQYRPQPAQIRDYRKGDLPWKIIGNPLHIFVVQLYNTVVKMITVTPSIQIYPKAGSLYIPVDL